MHLHDSMNNVGDGPREPHQPQQEDEEDELVSGENTISNSGAYTNPSGAQLNGISTDEEGYIGEFSRDYINAEIFKLFDVD